MPCFENLFMEAKIGEPVFYNGVLIDQIDKFPVKNGEVLVCSIEEAVKKPEYLQGFCIDITGYCELEGEVHKIGKGVRMLFWHEHTPPEFRLKIFSKLPYVTVYNICEVDTSYITSDENGTPIIKHSKRSDSKFNGAAMMVEEIESGRRYRCSDTNSAEKPFPFNDIVFTVRRCKEGCRIG